MVRLTSLLAALVGATAASCQNDGQNHDSSTGYTQMISYVKRHPDWTREDFWTHWQTVHAPKVAPLAAYFNITRYQQIQVGGMIPPTASGADQPANTTLVSFDGIAMFLYPDPSALTEMLAHPYYIDVVEKDEETFIDKSAYGAGMVATYVGNNIGVVNEGVDVWVGDAATAEKYQKLFETYL
ncbi:EthD domain-containing protein [Aspergillus pseudocaelatus]|uniref:EthD domain-containing protein n=1 Tax=Aspergillus pseudocaelatus TaxID=1825620 RepID=A0ABQ6WL81_9EURO|nr:EthD domain-containing protein [Aspergillus pseudocaelatus]